jgi:hypothetical protein
MISFVSPQIFLVMAILLLPSNFKDAVLRAFNRTYGETEGAVGKDGWAKITPMADVNHLIKVPDKGHVKKLNSRCQGTGVSLWRKHKTAVDEAEGNNFKSDVAHVQAAAHVQAVRTLKLFSITLVTMPIAPQVFVRLHQHKLLLMPT